MIKDTGIIISPDSESVIIRPYISADQSRIPKIISRVMVLTKRAAEAELKKIMRDFSARHHNFKVFLERIHVLRCQRLARREK